MTQSSEPQPFSVTAVFGPSPRSAWLAQIQAETSRRCGIRRERVLAHPDLAEALTRPPLDFPEPGMWNGYIPPREGHWAEPETLHSPARYFAGGFRNPKGLRTGPTELNDSPCREALLAIWAEVVRRDGKARHRAGLAAVDL